MGVHKQLRAAYTVWIWSSYISFLRRSLSTASCLRESREDTLRIRVHLSSFCSHMGQSARGRGDRLIGIDLLSLRQDRVSIYVVWWNTCPISTYHLISSFLILVAVDRLKPAKRRPLRTPSSITNMRTRIFKSSRVTIILCMCIIFWREVSKWNTSVDIIRQQCKIL